MIRIRKKKTDFFDEIIDKKSILPRHDRQKGLDFLINFFSAIRPSGNIRNGERNLIEAIQRLRSSRVLLGNLQHALLSLVTRAKLTSAITESGIPLARNFWQEFFTRIRHKILPALQDENDFLYIINSVFYKKNDFEWVESISRKTWIEFFESIGFSYSMRDEGLKAELSQSLKILSFQVAQLGLEKEVSDYLPSRDRKKDTPFVSQNYLVHDLESLLLQNGEKKEIVNASVKLKQVIEDCYNLIDHIRDSYSERGASLNQTYILLILSNRLERMQLIADALDTDGHFDTGRFVDVFKLLVRNENRKNSIREFLSQGAGYLAYQIAEHKGSRGHKYITSTAGEYWKMILSAMWGGFIVSFIAVFKNLLGKLTLAPVPLGLLYSINYSFGFILIDETGSTLATKQPAFTASAVAVSLDSRKHGTEPDLDNLAVTVAKVSRSQIASFVGNLLVVFPFTFLLAWLYEITFDKPIASGNAALKLLNDQHPWVSPSLLYACFTGFFLFFSGIIAGYVQNKIRYGRIRERLNKHPVLRMSMKAKRLDRIAVYIEENAGTLFGNIALGFFLGFSGVMGKLLGIPFDIRHITISAANSAIGVYGLGIENIDPLYLLTVLGGVLGIGFLNFLVSFSLAFSVAVKSRGIRFRQYPRFLRILGRHFLKTPLDFFRPPKRRRRLE